MITQSRHMNPEILTMSAGAEGSLTVVFVGDDDRVVLRVDIGEGTATVDELFLRHLVMLTADVGVPEVVFVVRRADARPRRVDRKLWRELSTRLAGGTTSLQDLVVLGETEWWSASLGRWFPVVSG